MARVTCRLTAKNRDQLRNPTLGNRVWSTFTFLILVRSRSGSARTEQSRLTASQGRQRSIYSMFNVNVNMLTTAACSAVHSPVSRYGRACHLWRPNSWSRSPTAHCIGKVNSCCPQHHGRIKVQTKCRGIHHSSQYPHFLLFPKPSRLANSTSYLIVSTPLSTRKCKLDHCLQWNTRA